VVVLVEGDMSKQDFRYVVPDVPECEFPKIRKEEGTVIRCKVCPDGEVQVVGNSKGLLYLARHFAAMGLLEKRNGLHLHLDPETGELEAGSAVLTICNLDFGSSGSRV
jgi:hypothetical protein